jgi:mRNA interferase MazF
MARRIVTRGSIVLVRYPFTDLRGTKVRPVILLTPDHLLSRFQDVACLFISSVIPSIPLPTDCILEMDHPSFRNTGLKCRSVIRAHKFTVLHKSLIYSILGETDAMLMPMVESKLCLALGLSRRS